MIVLNVDMINYDDYEELFMIFFLFLITILLYIILSNFYMSKPYNVVVFDLDETLGSFSQLSVLKDVIENYNQKKITQNEFNKLLEINPEFIRPGIISILKYIVQKRKQGKCYKIMIYTNNQGPKEWTEFISNYFSYKIGENVFDQIIAAFKINGKQIEPMRTSHDKSYNDFINCTKLPRNTQVFFVDDVQHPKMETDNVYYINIKPYHYKPPVKELIDKYVSSSKYNNNPVKKEHLMMIAKNIFSPKILNGVVKIEEEQELDEVLGKFMFQHVCKFFDSTDENNKYKNKNNKTLKKRSKK